MEDDEMILTRVDEGARIVLKLLVRGRMVENYLQLTGLWGGYSLLTVNQRHYGANGLASSHQVQG